MKDGRVAFLRGQNFGSGIDFDCTDRTKKNWVVVWHPVSRRKYPKYPLFHARADGTPIAEISREDFSDDNPRRLKAYLRKLQARITINGRTLP